MFYEAILEVRDKSYYVDELVKLTSHPRGYWSKFSLASLKQLLIQKSREFRMEVRREQYQRVS